MHGDSNGTIAKSDLLGGGDESHYFKKSFAAAARSSAIGTERSRGESAAKRHEAGRQPSRQEREVLHG